MNCDSTGTLMGYQGANSETGLWCRFLISDGKESPMNQGKSQRSDDWGRFFAPGTDNKLCWRLYDFLPNPDSKPVNPADVDQALEHRRHVRYRNHMLKLRLHAELKVLRLGLVSAEHRLMARLNGWIHPHAGPMVIHIRRHKR